MQRARRVFKRLKRLVSVSGHEGGVAHPRYISPLMRRILALNALPLALLSVTLLFLNEFQNSLLETEVSALREQAHIYAAALGQSAVMRRQTASFVTESDYALDPNLARPLLIRLTEPSPFVLSRLFAPDGRVIASSRGAHACHSHAPQENCRVTARLTAEDNPQSGFAEQPPAQSFRSLIERFYEWLLSFLPLTSRSGIVTLDDPEHRQNEASPGYRRAEDAPPYIRRTSAQKLIITVAKPVIHEGQTVGILQLTRAAPEVDRSLFAVRSSILSLFLAALTVTVFLSWYLSLTIARPLSRLSVASKNLRDGPGRVDAIAESVLSRSDEIGDLARALRESSTALWARMDATEKFAADVSHELKNPLSSIRSAIETLPRVASSEKRERLMTIIRSDVLRLDRLITDISVASRIDAELSRTLAAPINVCNILCALSDMYQAIHRPQDPVISVEKTPTGGVWAVMAEDRLVQVLRNLIENALSFSPPNGVISLECRQSETWVRISVSDDGPGIPPMKLEEIFDRFYSERPQTEMFGQHSGLGLSISRQIIDASQGRLFAENRLRENGDICGAKFIILLPALRRKSAER